MPEIPKAGSLSEAIRGQRKFRPSDRSGRLSKYETPVAGFVTKLCEKGDCNRCNSLKCSHHCHDTRAI